jgi:8-oxo-dGTP pyrophosphatase MutT (NUDIX family)
LLTAAQMGAARELFEETGMNVQSNLDRLQPASLRPDVEFDPETGSPTLGCELRQRLYFFLEVTDADFIIKVRSTCLLLSCVA